jgi:hypothetical protein
MAKGRCRVVKKAPQDSNFCGTNNPISADHKLQDSPNSWNRNSFSSRERVAEHSPPKVNAPECRRGTGNRQISVAPTTTRSKERQRPVRRTPRAVSHPLLIVDYMSNHPHLDAPARRASVTARAADIAASLRARVAGAADTGTLQPIATAI